MSEPEAPAGSTERMRVDVLSGSPTGEELAAIMAVVTEAYVEESAAATAEESARSDAWALSQRSLREPLRRNLGWGPFGG